MLVWDKRYNGESVIKSIGVQFNENDGKYYQKKAIELAENEINILKRLEHPGIVKYRGCRHQITNQKDWWKHQTYLYLHMDYVSGKKHYQLTSCIFLDLMIVIVKVAR